MSKQRAAAAGAGAAAAAVTGREAALKSLQVKRRSFFDLAIAERNLGVGRRFKRIRDNGEETFFEPTHVTAKFTVRTRQENNKHSLTGSLQITGKARGTAVGVYTFRGMREDVERPIKSGFKKEWKMLPEGLTGSTVQNKD
jgi:hypothetical protein